MKTRWMLAIGIGLLLAAQGAVVQAQNLERRPAKADDSAGAGREGQPYATAVARGNAYLQNRQDEDALEQFAVVVTYAKRVNSHPDLTYALYRMGTAHRNLFDRTGSVEHLKAAIAAWEQERALYERYGYPPSFAALAGFSLGRAYLDLARYENVAENTERALDLLEKSVAQFRTGIASYQAAIQPR